LSGLVAKTGFWRLLGEFGGSSAGKLDNTHGYETDKKTPRIGTATTPRRRRMPGSFGSGPVGFPECPEFPWEIEIVAPQRRRPPSRSDSAPAAQTLDTAVASDAPAPSVDARRAGAPDIRSCRSPTRGRRPHTPSSRAKASDQASQRPTRRACYEDSWSARGTSTTPASTKAARASRLGQCRPSCPATQISQQRTPG